MGRLDRYGLPTSYKPLQFGLGPVFALRTALRITANAWIFFQATGWIIGQETPPAGLITDVAGSLGVRWQW